MSTTIHDALTALDALAPLELAAPWDNVGLLLEGDRSIERVLVTIDLDSNVLEEAEQFDADLVIAYHPTWFGKTRRLTHQTPHGTTLLRLARLGMHLYSPHTALDAIPSGINDWLLEAFEGVEEVRPIQPDPGRPEAGVGRSAVIRALTGAQAIERIKHHLGLSHVRVAGDLTTSCRTLAVCPGSGSSVFDSLGDVDLLVTGEMGHHDALKWVARGTVVILTEHSNSERGYLQRYADQVSKALGVDVHVSNVDADPLRHA